MSVEITTVIAKQTAAATEIYGFRKGDLPATITVDGTLGAAETIAVNSRGINNSDVTPATDDFGNALELSLTKQMVAVGSPCRLQFVKGITAAAVGVFIQK